MSWTSHWKWRFVGRILFALWSTGLLEDREQIPQLLKFLYETLYVYDFRNCWHPSVDSIHLHISTFWLCINFHTALVWNRTPDQTVNETRKKLNYFNCGNKFFSTVSIVCLFYLSTSDKYIINVDSLAYKNFALKFFASQLVLLNYVKVIGLIRWANIFKRLTGAAKRVQPPWHQRTDLTEDIAASLITWFRLLRLCDFKTQ